MRHETLWMTAAAAVAAFALATPVQAAPVSTQVKLEGWKKRSTACVNEKSTTCTEVKKRLPKGSATSEEGGCLKLVAEGEIWSKAVKVDVLISHHNLPRKLAQVGCGVDEECPDSRFPFDPVWLQDGAWARFYLGNFEEQVFAKRDVSGNPLVWVSDDENGCYDDGLCEFVGRCKSGLYWDKITEFIAAANLDFEVEAVDGEVGKRGPEIIIRNVLLTAVSKDDVYVWLSKMSELKSQGPNKPGKFGCDEYNPDPAGCAAEVGLEVGLITPNRTLYTGLGVAKKLGEDGVAVTGNPGIFIYYKGELIFSARFQELRKAL